MKPVALPPGCARLSTKPEPTGSGTIVNTTGTIRIDYRFSGGDAATSRKQAEELVALAPDVIVTSGSFSTGILLQATRTDNVGGLEVDCQCIAQWCLDRQISRIVPFENPGDISTSIAKLVDEVDTIGN